MTECFSDRDIILQGMETVTECFSDRDISLQGMEPKTEFFSARDFILQGMDPMIECSSRRLPCFVHDLESFWVSHELAVKEEKQGIVHFFRSQYLYSSGGQKDITNCISSGGKRSWQDQSLGITWVAVRGMDSICVIARNKLDKSHVGGRFFRFQPRKTILYRFMETLIYEMEGCSLEMIDCIEKPYALVSSLAPEVDEESGHEGDQKEALDYLTATFKGDKSFGLDDTVETAICAMQHLCHRKLKTSEIVGYVLKPDKTYARGIPDIHVKEHLAVINKKKPQSSLTKKKKTKSAKNGKLPCQLTSSCEDALNTPRKNKTKSEKNGKLPCQMTSSSEDAFSRLGLEHTPPVRMIAITNDCHKTDHQMT